MMTTKIRWLRHDEKRGKKNVLKIMIDIIVCVTAFFFFVRFCFFNLFLGFSLSSFYLLWIQNEIKKGKGEKMYLTTLTGLLG